MNEKSSFTHLVKNGRNHNRSFHMEKELLYQKILMTVHSG